ncbi:MAG: clostripain-related cysteine peptidase [Prevotella sp.]|jgi:hypothetical protein
MKSIRHIFILTVFLSVGLLFSACSDDDDGGGNSESELSRQTIFVLMPWSGTDSNSGLYSYFLENIESMKAGIKDNGGLSDCRLIVMLASSPLQGRLFEITYENGATVEHLLKNYSSAEWLTSQGIAGLLDTVKAQAPASSYAMIIGSHGVGWTYKDDWTEYPYRIKRAMSHTAGRPLTRFFGSVEEPAKYGIDVETLADGIEQAGLQMQYILFDDCYMANAETAYALRKVSQYLVGSTSEVMAAGMPYEEMWNALVTNDYSEMTSEFYDFYSSYYYPYGALSVINCKQVDGLATIMQQINSRYTMSDATLDSVQVVDGFSPTIFYDLGDYVHYLCKDSSLTAQFDQQMKQVVVSTAHTHTLYSAISDSFFTLIDYSGITISDPSTHTVAVKGKEKTEWWTATH